MVITWPNEVKKTRVPAPRTREVERLGLIVSMQSFKSRGAVILMIMSTICNEPKARDARGLSKRMNETGYAPIKLTD